MDWEGSENRGKGEALEDKAENFGLRRDFMVWRGLRVLALPTQLEGNLVGTHSQC